MLIVRRAEGRDAAAMSRVLIASITELCVGDHHHDAAALAAWTRNKSVDGVAAMLADPDLMLWVAELHGVLAGVGAVTRQGDIALNYVAPEQRFQGVSKAMLARLEAELRELGFTEGRLEATATARRFYQSAGWHPDGPQASGRRVNGYPMRKRLGP